MQHDCHGYSSTVQLLFRTSGFAEYYDPVEGVACGGQSFSWTAAMVLEFLNNAREPIPAEPI